MFRSFGIYSSLSSLCLTLFASMSYVGELHLLVLKVVASGRRCPVGPTSIPPPDHQNQVFRVSSVVTGLAGTAAGAGLAVAG